LVNIKLNADDSTRSRSTMRYDPVSGQGFNLDCALPESDGGEEEGGTSESAGVDFKDILSNDKFVQRSEDLAEGISSDLDNFAAKVLPIHEELLTSCLESYRGTVAEVFNFSGVTLSKAKENMMRQISVLDIPRALIPIELKNIEELPEEISTDELLRSVRNFNKPSQLFRWRRSRWGRYCPVALADGELVLGSPNFALAFLGKMFFISSQERYENFKINPRKYLIPTKPNNPLRIAVTGFPESGKSTIAAELAKLFNCEIIRPDELVVEEKQKANKDALAKKRAEVTELAMGMVQSTLGTDEKVEETDPRVQEIINNQMEEAVQAEGPPLPPAVYVSKIKQHVADLCESRKNASESLCNGRWIIDGFPNTKADWNAMSEEGFMPNDLIVIRSQSDGYEDLMEAYFERNQDRLIEAYQTRRKAEKEEGEDNPIEPRPPLTATEFDPFRSQIRNCDSALAQLTTNIYSSETSVLQLTYSHDNLGEMIKKVDSHIESRFEIQPWPWTGIDQQDEEDDSEFLGESEDDPFLANRDWGNTKNFDPVLLKDTNVLVPGDLEFQIKYKDDIFCCMDDENREKFLDAPEKYVSAEMPSSTPPPIRICCVGQLGSGKSTQIAKLAKEQGIFHIDWKSFLEEKLLEKYEKRIGPSHIESNRLLAEQKLHEKEAMKTMLDAIVYPPEPNNSEENSKEEENDPEEESIKEYLESGEPIPYDTLDKLLRQFWREDPYKSKGFILEGFPSSADDLRYISGSANFPDSLLVLKCEKEVTVKRLLPERLATWQAWFDLKEKRRQAIREHKESVRDRWIDSETAIAMAEEEIEEGTDVETLEQEMRERVASKFDESFLEVEDEFPESVEEAKERLSGEMMNETALERERLNNMFDLVEQAQIPKFEITCNRKPEEAYAKIKVALEKFLPPFRAAMFERVRGISLAQAENLLKANYFQLSSFGQWDPVELTAGNAFKPLDHNEGGVSFPVIYKSYIYFLNSLENRTKFVRNPLAYVQQQISSTIPSPHYNQRIAVVGPPKSGKTTLAKRMSAELGLLKVSVEDVVETLTSKFSKTVIAEQGKFIITL
jgi:adenylate/nucleoside-diphosphate kinase